MGGYMGGCLSDDPGAVKHRFRMDHRSVLDWHDEPPDFNLPAAHRSDIHVLVVGDAVNRNTQAEVALQQQLQCSMAPADCKTDDR